MAATGLRVSEAIGLKCSDVDLGSGVLTIRKSKFGKNRLVPLHHTTRKALSDYARRRDEIVHHGRSTRFFVSPRGANLRYTTLLTDFHKLLLIADIQDEQSGRRPRMHDLRHTFVVRSLINWYRRGEDAQANLPILSTYLGHDSVRSTYWYLSAVPELMTHVVRRLERRWERTV